LLLLALFFSGWAALQVYLTAVTDQAWLHWSLPLTIVTICLLLFEQWCSPYINARRQFNNTPSAHGLIALDAHDAGLRFRATGHESSLSWDRYIRWREDERIFLLFSSPWMFVIIPKRAFDSALQRQFREMLLQNISAVNKR
jgi:hypothetical protein